MTQQHNSTQEHYQKKMNQILEGIEGQISSIDDVFIHGKTQAEHDRRLKDVLKKLESAGATLNAEKCAFSRREVKFAGYMFLTKMELCPIWRRQILSQHRSFPKCE